MNFFFIAGLDTISILDTEARDQPVNFHIKKDTESPDVDRWIVTYMSIMQLSTTATSMLHSLPQVQYTSHFIIVFGIPTYIF